MIICIPSLENKGLKSLVSEHFGRAPFHCIVNSTTGSTEVLAKPEGEPGHCVPFSALRQYNVEVVLCKGIGRGAVMNFTNAGIPVMRTSATTIEAAIQEFKNEKLAPVGENDLCEGHDHDHDHDHDHKCCH